MGGQMTSHMEEPRRNVAHVGKILLSVCDCGSMKVRIINNSAGLGTIFTLHHRRRVLSGMSTLYMFNSAGKKTPVNDVRKCSF